MCIRDRINGVYCTGKTLDEVNEELQEESSYPGLTIIDSDGKSYMISAQEVSLLMDYLPGLKAFYEKQSPLLWIDNMLGEKNNHEILPVVSYQVETFEEKVAKLPFFTGIRPENRRVKLCKGPQVLSLIHISFFTSVYILVDRVSTPAPLVKCVIIKSSRDMVKAIRNPDKIPGMISGRTTL